MPADPSPSQPHRPRRSGEPNRGRGSRITSRRSPPTGDQTGNEPARKTAPRGRFRQAPVPADDGLERLQKVLAAAGLGSRRNCEELITTGRVEVDRQVVTQLGTRVDPLRQEIRVDGERLPDPKRVVYMLSKPVGVVTTNFDPDGRPRVVDLVPGEQRLFAIGRLDRMSEGLILVTNDGELANLLAHPRYGVEKKYLVQVAGVPTPDTIDKLRRGIGLAEGMARAQHVHMKSQHKQSAVLEMVLDEGKNREIRRMLAHLGHKVHQLKRVAVGKLSLGDLLPGQWRQLAWSEVEALRKDALAQTAGFADGPPRGAHGPRPRGTRRPFGQRDDDRRGGRPAGAGGRSPRPSGSAPGRVSAGPGGRGRTAAPVPAGRPPARPRFLDRAEGAGPPPATARRPPAAGRPPRPPRDDEGSARPPRGDRPVRPRFLDRAEGAGPPPAPARRPPAVGRPPRPPRDDEGSARPPRPPRGDGSARPPRPAGQDDSRPPLPGGRRRRPGKASTWRKKRDS